MFNSYAGCGLSQNQGTTQSGIWLWCFKPIIANLSGVCGVREYYVKPNKNTAYRGNDIKILYLHKFFLWTS